MRFLVAKDALSIYREALYIQTLQDIASGENCVSIFSLDNF